MNTADDELVSATDGFIAGADEFIFHANEFMNDDNDVISDVSEFVGEDNNLVGHDNDLIGGADGFVGEGDERDFCRISGVLFDRRSSGMKAAILFSHPFGARLVHAKRMVANLLSMHSHKL